MRSQRGKFIVLLVLVLILVLLVTHRVEQHVNEMELDLLTGSNRIPSRYDPNFAYRFQPYQGRVEIKQDLEAASLDMDGKTALDGMSQEQVTLFRMQRVKEYQQLGFFRPGYHPLQYNSRRIYQNIFPGVKWMGPTPYYVSNPYVLVVAACASRVTPLNLYCADADIFYDNGVITETHRGKNAECWLRIVFDKEYSRNPGTIWLLTVNAYDAGFYYVHVDPRLSKNIEPSPDRRNIVNWHFTQSFAYHWGHARSNNISPNDTRSWIRLKQKDAFTRIHVKLWRDRPRSLEQKPDLVYEIQVIPER